MNKKIKIFGVLFALIITFFSDTDANAGLFDWVTQNSDTGYLVSSDWSLDKVLRDLQLTKDEVKQDEKVEEEIVQSTAVKPAKTAEAKRKMVVIATAYSSTPDQTDDTPFITARGTLVRDGIIAANFLPFGTQIRIPDVFGNKVFVVEDRMNRRHQYRIDVWFPERAMAREFGIKKVTIEII